MNVNCETYIERFSGFHGNACTGNVLFPKCRERLYEKLKIVLRELYNLRFLNPMQNST